MLSSNSNSTSDEWFNYWSAAGIIIETAFFHDKSNPFTKYGGTARF